MIEGGDKQVSDRCLYVLHNLNSQPSFRDIEPLQSGTRTSRPYGTEASTDTPTVPRVGMNRAHVADLCTQDENGEVGAIDSWLSTVQSPTAVRCRSFFCPEARTPGNLMQSYIIQLGDSKGVLRFRVPLNWPQWIHPLRVFHRRSRKYQWTSCSGPSSLGHSSDLCT